ncbi:Vacuolar protein-sorting-associated protein 28, variant 2 [Puccinia graminis f. sp. tritici]|uniref:Vacuolar protein sorting-associated protein 28 n=1 Tax=Puccinia graminis f. sp. tritici TaxID=56615 RepID=A0A5B0PCP3_PUCGR|nr:Vacuolar protein-sorting-associated protein 28, variant 2 [Puccinia graminis f. sp. tritici]
MPLNLDEEFKLYSTNAEREKYDNQATLYSIILSLEYLERAYVRDSITQAQYTPACGRLLGHFKTLLNLVGGDLQWIQNFMAEYRMDCQAAANRIRVGVPATVEHSSEEGNESSKASRGVAETTQNFITFMDALKLKMRAKDQLHPLLSELMVGYSKFPKSQEWEGRPKILHWWVTGITISSRCSQSQISTNPTRKSRGNCCLLAGFNRLITLNSMRASDEITDEQSRQILFDIDSAYQEFYKSLT